MQLAAKYPILLVTLFLLLFLPACSDSKDNRISPNLKNGVIDLRNWNFQKDGPVDLVGSWKFYWKRFLTFENLRLHDEDFTFVNSPGIWNGVKSNGEETGASGYATYRATVLVNKNTENLSLRFQNVYSAYTVYIDNIKIGSVGAIATEPETAEEIKKPTIMNVTVDKDQFNIIIHVSNYHFLYGGMVSKVTMGLADDIRLKRESAIAVEMLLSGIALFVGLFHLFLIYPRRRLNSHLYFGINLLSLLAYLIVTGEYFSLLQDYISSFEAVLRIIVVSYALSIMFFSAFVESIYGRVGSNLILKLQFVFFCLFVILGLIVSVDWIPFIHIGNQIMILITILTAWKTTFIATRKKQPGARLLNGGITISLLTTINDFAIFHAIIDTANYWGLGFLVLGVAQNLVLSIHASLAYKKVESLSESLQKSNKRLQKLDELKNDFLARTSHELRTPLSGIIGTTETVLQKSGYLLPEDDFTSLSAVISNGTRLTYLINDILDYSKLKKKEIAIYRFAVDVLACSRLVTDLLKPLFEHKRLKLIHFPAEGLPLVYADDARLQQVFHNLISNAVKFTPEGGTIELSARKQGSFLSISVKDSGCGIPEEELENVFIPFEQVESPHTGTKAGTGLGLSITKNLVELHSGSISITSTVGKGTKVSFRLPLFNEEKVGKFAKAESPATSILPLPPRAVYFPEGEFRQSLQTVEERIQNNASPTILIVDDEPINLMVLTNQLSLAEYNTITAASGTKALELIGEKEIDLVLLDYMMPDLNGYEVLKKIRELESTPTSFPVIMVTAFFHSDTAAKCFDQGANDYLYKPVKKEDLLMRVKNQLEIKEKVELNERLKTYKKMKTEFEELKQMEQVINALDEKIIVVQSEKKIVFSNRSAEKFIGYHPQELLGMNLDRLIHEDSMSRLWNRKSQLNVNSGLKNAMLEPRIVIQNKNGDHIRTSISISQYQNDGEIRYALIIKADEAAEFDRSIKEKAVKIINDSLWLWKTYLGKTKLQLAKESGIWTVSFDMHKGTEKAQTMEKYLKIKTFPSKRPKINAVANTVLFVLDQEAIPVEKKEELRIQLKEFSEAGFD